MIKKKTFRRLLTAALAALLLLSAGAPAALAAVQVRIIATTDVYSVPSTSAASIRVPAGLTVSMTAYQGDWARVSYKGNTAYIPLAYLNLVNRLTAYTAKSTPVYKNPSTSSQQLGTLSIATAVYVVGKVGNFYRVQNASGSVTGYVVGSDLTTKAKITAAYNAYMQAQTATTSGGSATDKLLYVLKSLCGKPYGNNAPNSFNCSSLVQYVMGGFGISMKGTASEQANDGRYSKISSISSLRVGDILCFDENGDGTCDHTAIYIGNNYFVEASRNAGKVQVNNFTDWYRSHFMWARRPV